MSVHATISLKEVIEIMDSGAKFSIGFRTCDLHKKTGGEWVDYPVAEKLIRQTPAEIAAEKRPREQANSKNPRHFENSTRNLVLPSGDIRKVHLRLIRTFNSKSVL